MVYYESISSEVQAYRTELIRRKYIDTKKALSHERAFFCPLLQIIIVRAILKIKKGKSHDFHNSSNLNLNLYEKNVLQI